MTLLEMSGSAAVLIAIILLLRRFALYRLPKWTFLALWAVALCRLLVPVSVPSQFSVYTGVELALQALRAEEAPDTDSPESSRSADPVPAWEIPAAPDRSPTLSQTPAAAPAVSPAEEGARAEGSVPPLAVVYCLGAGLCGLCFGLAYWRCRREFRTAVPAERDFLTRWQAAHPTRPPVQIKVCGRIKAPLTYGLFRPVILLPLGTNWADEEQLRYVLAHEYVHIRRRDVWWKLLLILALCLHWFNPLVWAMYFVANRDLELSCDEAVVWAFGPPARSAYALSLIKAEEEKWRFMPLCSSYRKSEIEERITAIMKIKKKSAAALTAALLLVVGVTVAFATSAAPTDPSPDPARAVQAGDAAEPDNSQAQTAGEETEAVSTPVQKAEREAALPAPETADPDPVPADEPPAQPLADQEDETPQGTQPESDPSPAQEPAAETDTASALEERWGWVEVAPYPESTEIPVVNRTQGEELAEYLEQVRGIRSDDIGYVIYDDGRMYVFVHYGGTKKEEQFWALMPDGKYPTNSKGESYGSSRYSKYTGYEPDLIAVMAENGESGYVLREDYEAALELGYQGEEVRGLSYAEWCKNQPMYYYIPVYDAEHETVIGEYAIYNPESSARSQEDIEEELETVARTMKNSLGMSDEEIEAYIQQKREEYAR